MVGQLRWIYYHSFLYLTVNLGNLLVHNFIFSLAKNSVARSVIEQIQTSCANEFVGFVVVKAGEHRNDGGSAGFIVVAICPYHQC